MGALHTKNWQRPVVCVEIWLGGTRHTFMPQRTIFNNKKTVYNETQDRMEQIPPKKQKMCFFFQSLLLKNHSAGLK